MVPMDEQNEVQTEGQAEQEPQAEVTPESETASEEPAEVENEEGQPGAEEAVPEQEEAQPEEPEAEEVADEPKSEIPSDVVRVSVTLACEVHRSSFGGTAGDVRDILLNHAKREWANTLGTVTKEQAKFENC